MDPGKILVSENSVLYLVCDVLLYQGYTSVLSRMKIRGNSSVLVGLCGYLALLVCRVMHFQLVLSEVKATKNKMTVIVSIRKKKI
jgi:hypothetical protein